MAVLFYLTLNKKSSSLVMITIYKVKEYKTRLLLLLPICFFFTCTFAQQVIPLYYGPAPGSENWTWEEKETGNTLHKFKVSYNITKPALTVFSPDTANGTAVIICPGGGFHVLNIEHEGEMIAKELNKKGITAFVLRYRVVHSLTNDPWQEMMNSLKGDSAAFQEKIGVAKKLATDDARKALDYVRKHAAEYKLDPKKIGMIGFSGGGTLTINLCLTGNKDTKPDFAALIYSVFRPTDTSYVMAGAPPVFIACASDDQFASPINSVNLYNAWRAAGKLAELHVYSAGGHGLRAAHSVTWLKRFEDWLGAQGYIKP